MAPTLVTTPYAVYANASNTTTLTTPSFTPANGEVLVVKLATWDTTIAMGAPTNTGSQTFSAVKLVAPGGFTEWCGIYAATVSGSPGAMTVSSTPAATSWHSMVVERWSGAQLAVTPATNATITGTSSPPSVTLTTTAASSVVTWVSGDTNSTSPATRAYLSSATEDGLQDGSVGSNGVTYFAYQTAAAAGSQTFGMSLPTNQHWNIAGMEVQAAASPASPTPPPPRIVSQAVKRAAFF